jgi:hypothetical protein
MGKEQSIRITDSGRLAEAEVVRMAGQILYWSSGSASKTTATAEPESENPPREIRIIWIPGSNISANTIESVINIVDQMRLDGILDDKIKQRLKIAIGDIIQYDRPRPGLGRYLFLSYRRQDSLSIAGRMFDRLNAIFPEIVQFDQTSIPYGADFRKHLEESIRDSFALVAIIGRGWLVSGSGGPIIENEQDYVRLELETALRYEVPIVPVLVGDAKMPGKAELPTRLKIFSSINAASLSEGRNFHPDMASIIDRLKDFQINKST